MSNSTHLVETAIDGLVTENDVGTLFGFVAVVNGGLYDQYAQSTLAEHEVRRAGPCQVTTSDVLGPYYKANAPFRQLAQNAASISICDNSPAHDRLFMNGTIRRLVNGQGCEGSPVKALIDVWSADNNGVYSNTSPQSPDFGCRVRFYTRDDGSYSFQSVFPGRYDDGGYRPAHIHFRITPVDRYNRPIQAATTLTTQLYFANDKYLGINDSCQICGSKNPSQIANVVHYDDIKSFVGSWNTVLAA